MQSRLGWCGTWLALVMCTGHATKIFAQSVPTARGPALGWVRQAGAEACIPPVELSERVERRLGRPVFVRTPDAVMLIEGEIAPREPQGFTAKIRVSDARGEVFGERVLALGDADCRRLDEVIALVIAVTIHDPSGGANGIPLPADVAAVLEALFADEPSELDPAEPPASIRKPGPTQASTRSSDVAVPSVPTKPEATQPFELSAGAGFLFVSGLAPSGTLGPTVHVRFGLRGVFGVVLTGALGLPQRETVIDPSSNARAAMAFQPSFGALSLCTTELPLLESGFSACARVGVGQVEATPTGFIADNTPVSELWVELGPEISARALVLDPLYVKLSLGVPVRLSRPKFQYKQRDASTATVFSVASVGFQSELSVGVGFW